MGKGGARAGCGAKVIPMIEKQAKGTFRPHRQKAIPVPSGKLPIPPRWLNPDAKRIFKLMVKRIGEITVASMTHTEGISILASRLEEVQRLTKFIDINGSSFDKYGVNREGVEFCIGSYPRPESKQRSDAIRHLHTLLLEFGLTPSSLGRVKAKADKGKERNEFENF
jgi:P27 family predicted phage terminase small subunit